MPVRDQLNHSLVIVIVGAAWLSGKIGEAVAIPVLLALAGLIALPQTVAARNSGLPSSASSDKNKAVIPPSAPLVMLLGAGCTLSMLTKFTQFLALAAVTVGLGACGVDYSSIVDRTGHALLAMRESYLAACNEGLDTSEACRSWGTSFNTIEQIYTPVNDALKVAHADDDGGI